jgi:hypothetical protein
MIARLISLQVFKFPLAIGAGAFISFVGILFHNSLPPAGLIAAYFITYLGIRALGTLAQSRIAMWVATVTWFGVLVLASNFGTSFERLVVGNTNGNLYSVGGSALAVLAAARRIK